MHDGAGDGVQAGAAVFLGRTDAQQAEFTHAAQEFEVELLITVVFEGLWLDVLLGPFTDHLSQHLVFFARVGDVHVGHDTASSRWLLTFGADTGHSRNKPSESKRQILSFNQEFKGQIKQAFSINNSIPSTVPVAFQRHKFVVDVQ